MKRFICLILLLLALAYVGVLLYQQPGYLVLQLKQSSLSAPLWLVALGVIIFVILVTVIWKGIAALFLIPSKIKGHFDRNREQKQKQHLDAGLRAWMAKDWAAVDKHFTELNHSGWDPTLAQLIANHANNQPAKAN